MSRDWARAIRGADFSGNLLLVWINITESGFLVESVPSGCYGALFLYLLPDGVKVISCAS